MSYSEILADSPAGFWPLDDLSGSTCVASAGADAGITGASFTRAALGHGAYPRSTNLTYQPSDTRITTGVTSLTSTFTAEVGFNIDDLSVVQTIISKGAYYAPTTTAFPFSIVVNTDGSITANLDSGNDFTVDTTITSSPGVVTAGAWYLLAYRHRDNGLCELLLGTSSGVSVIGSATISYPLSTTAYALTFGAPANPYSGGVGARGFKGKLVGAAYFTAALSNDRVIAHKAVLQDVPTNRPAGFSSTHFGTPIAPYAVAGFLASHFGTPAGYVATTITGGAHGFVSHAFGVPVAGSGYTPAIQYGRPSSIHSTRFGTPSTTKMYIAKGFKSPKLGAPRKGIQSVTGTASGFSSSHVGKPSFSASRVVSGLRSVQFGLPRSPYRQIGYPAGFTSTKFGSPTGPRPKWLDYDSIVVMFRKSEVIVRGL